MSNLIPMCVVLFVHLGIFQSAKNCDMQMPKALQTGIWKSADLLKFCQFNEYGDMPNLAVQVNLKSGRFPCGKCCYIEIYSVTNVNFVKLAEFHDFGARSET